MVGWTNGERLREEEGVETTASEHADAACRSVRAYDEQTNTRGGLRLRGRAALLDARRLVSIDRRRLVRDDASGAIRRQ